MQSIEWCHFQCLFVDTDLHFKVTIFFNFKYIENFKHVLKLFSASGSPTIILSRNIMAKFRRGRH